MSPLYEICNITAWLPESMQWYKYTFSIHAVNLTTVLCFYKMQLSTSLLAIVFNTETTSWRLQIHIAQFLQLGQEILKFNEKGWLKNKMITERYIHLTTKQVHIKLKSG
jgi:hypothetical protein